MATDKATMRVLRVLVSSPGDVQAERDVLDEVVASINRVEGPACGVRVELFRWERDVVPRIGPRPQEAVDAQLPPYDVYLGIMSTRFGTPTARYGSGTEQEFRDALQQWQQAGTPWITFYFDAQPKMTGDPAQAEQYFKVCQFRKELEQRGLVTSYAGVRGRSDSFFEKVSEHLRKRLQEFAHAQAASAPSRNKTPKPRARRTDQPAAKPRPKPTVPAAYRDWLLARCQEVELMGLQVKHGQAARLNQVYVPLTTPQRPDRELRPRGDTDREMMAEMLEQVQLLLALLDQHSLYVSGDPGSGKSTFCRWVTWLVCTGDLPPAEVPAPDEYREVFPEALRGRLPLFVRLRALWPHLPAADGRTMGLAAFEQALARWLQDQKAPAVDGASLRAHLEHGSALVLLDGVDEVPPVQRHAGPGGWRSSAVPQPVDEWFPRALLIEAVADAVRAWTAAGNRVLVTSRPYGVEADQQQRLGLRHAPLPPLPPPLQQVLVRRWFVRLSDTPMQGLATAADMLDHLHSERSLDELATNPLLLTAMCIIYDEGKRLPQDKYELYDRIVGTVLHKRYPPVKERVSVIRGRLAAVALGLHTGEELGQRRESPEASASDRELDLILQAYQHVDGSTDKGLSNTVQAREDLLSLSGLLVARGDDRASFYHLSFQEFLAAERLFVLRAREPEGFVNLLLERGPAPGWRNTLAFLFGCLITKFNTHVGVELLQALIGRLALPPIDPSRRGQAGGVWNVTRVLGECLHILLGREAAVPDALKTFFQQAVERAIAQEIAVAERQALAVILGRLGDPRVVPDLRVSGHPDTPAGYVPIPAGTYYSGDDRQPFRITTPFWLSRYPVTNGQYRLFRQDGGYTRRDCWSAEGWQWLQQQPAAEPDLWRDPTFNAPTQPVVDVSFWEAEAFCRWAGGQLPTERQWEAAARGPDGHPYPWGDGWADGICNSREAGLGCPSAVGIFPRSRSVPFGLEDLAGNVWEWCCDRLAAAARVIRGGSWANDARACRAASRGGWNAPAMRSGGLGFRVALSPPGSSQQGPGQFPEEAEPGP